MEFNRKPVEGPIRPAATVMLLRDAPGGMEVFMLKRHDASDVMAGVYVFPGGKLDREDAELDAEVHLDRSADELHAALGDPQLSPELAAGLHVAAVREVFEETGLLLAEGMSDALAERATAFAREGHSFGEVMEQFGLRLRTREMGGWSRWITPKVPTLSTKRFDVRFFIARLPEGLSASHDAHEAVDSAWFRPRDALQVYWDGQIKLAPPQIMSLAHLSRHPTVDSALEEARSRPPPLIEPQHIDLEDGRILLYPGDKEHPVAERRMPGPLRITLRGKRFEPEGGFEGFFL